MLRTNLCSVNTPHQ